MSILSGLTESQDIKQERDVIMGGSYGPVESGLYEGTVDMEYIKTSANTGAVAISFAFKTADGSIVKEDLWVQSGTKKGSKNYYVGKDGSHNYLPGFTAANSIALLTAGKPIAELDTSTKLVKVYSKEASGEVPTEVEVLHELLDKPIIAGILKRTVDKTQQGDDGQYHPTGEFRDENSFDKFFRHSDRLTTAEIRGGGTDSPFADKWLAANEGKTIDKTTKNVTARRPAQTNSGTFGAATASQEPAQPATPASGGLFTAAG
jgi:hypothetical protein